jgi:alkane 1-monooxygenase
MFNNGWVIFLPMIIAFGILPLVEWFIHPNEKNLNEAEEAMALHDHTYDVLLYAVVPLQYGALIAFLFQVNEANAEWWERAGRIMVMGLSCGIFGINVGHELGHRQNRWEQYLAKALLLTSLYTHFFIEHNRGHHKHVSTPGDPSSAPYRMSLYRFWWRSVRGVYKEAWQISFAETKKKGRKPWSWQNEMLQLQVFTAIFLATILVAFGWQVLGYYLLAACMGILLLETVNYIEHYGLARKKTTQEKYERAMPWHSWNSNHMLGRMFLFELSRHSDHHYLASRKYQVLRHHANAPQLPTGYPGSMLLATLPPLWFAVMDRQMKKYKIDFPP